MYTEWTAAAVPIYIITILLSVGTVYYILLYPPFISSFGLNFFSFIFYNLYTILYNTL